MVVVVVFSTKEVSTKVRGNRCEYVLFTSCYCTIMLVFSIFQEELLKLALRLTVLQLSVSMC